MYIVTKRKENKSVFKHYQMLKKITLIIFNQLIHCWSIVKLQIRCPNYFIQFSFWLSLTYPPTSPICLYFINMASAHLVMVTSRYHSCTQINNTASVPAFQRFSVSPFKENVNDNHVKGIFFSCALLQSAPSFFLSSSAFSVYPAVPVSPSPFLFFLSLCWGCLFSLSHSSVMSAAEWVFCRTLLLC